MKRAALIASGVVLVLLGLLLIAAGGAAAALFGSDGSLSTAPARVSGSGVALVVEDISIDASSIPVPEGVGTLTLSVADTRGRTMFVGSAPSEAVDTYLTGAPYDVVVAVAAGSDATTRAVPGTQQPAPPTTQPFWTRQATGRPAELTARVSSAASLVVMNADATPGVNADLVVTLTVARAWTAAWIAVGVGALLVLLGIVAFWRARVAGRRARAAAATQPVAAAVAVASPGATILPGGEAGPETAVLPVVVADVVAPAAEPPATPEPLVAPAPAEEADVAPATPAPAEEADVAPATPAAGADLGDTADLTAAAALVVAAESESDSDQSGSSAVEGAVTESAEPTTVAPIEAAAYDDPTMAAVPDAAVPDVAATAVGAPAPDVDPAPAVDAPTQDAIEVETDEQPASPVDMAALFAPAPADDATVVIPVVSGAPAPAATDAPADADTTGPVAPTETQHPAG